MESTMQLLQRARSKYSNDAQLCRELDMSSTTLAVADTRGKLSPVAAGNLARLLGENEEHWIAVAALEAAPPSKGKTQLLKEIARRVKRSFYGPEVRAQDWPSRLKETVSRALLRIHGPVDRIPAHVVAPHQIGFCVA